MKTFAAAVAVAVAVAVALSAPLFAQETKPVPKDSVRVSIPGCTKGMVFTAGPRTEDQPGHGEIRDGMHMRMNGQKKMMAEIKAHEGSMVEITGLVKKGQYRPDGVGIGHGVRIMPGSSPSSGSLAVDPSVSQMFIDVEGWRPIVGDCPSR